MIVKLLNDHITNGGFSRSSSTGNTCSIITATNCSFSFKLRERESEVESDTNNEGLIEKRIGG
jgi:hypothetical protein